MEVPVQLEGLAEGVRAGGKLALQMRKLKVKALYNAIPERLVVDVTFWVWARLSKWAN